MDQDEEDRRESEREGAKRRQLARQRCLLGAFLVRPGSEHVEPVSLKNLSLSGALLTMEGLGLLPEGTVLVIPRLEAAYEVAVIWREPPHIGVRFTRNVSLESDAHLQAVLDAAVEAAA